MELLKLFYDTFVYYIDNLFSIVETTYVWFSIPENVSTIIDLLGTVVGSGFAALNDPYIIPVWLELALFLNLLAFGIRFVTGAWSYILSLIPVV